MNLAYDTSIVHQSLSATPRQPFCIFDTKQEVLLNRVTDERGTGCFIDNGPPLQLNIFHKTFASFA